MTYQQSLPGNLCADCHQFVGFREAALLQTGEDLHLIHEHGKLTLLRTNRNGHVGTVQLLLQFGSETRCPGLLPSGCAVLDCDLHVVHSF